LVDRYPKQQEAKLSLG